MIKDGDQKMLTDLRFWLVLIVSLLLVSLLIMSYPN